MVCKRKDRRVRRSRRLLTEALLELMQGTEYDSISIRQLTEAADVGYTTFFRHFKTKDELLGFALGSVMEPYENALSSDMNKQEQAVAFIQNVDQNRQAYLAGLTLPPGHPVLKTLHERAKQLLAERCVSGVESDVPVNVIVNHFIWATYEFVRWYLVEPHDCSPDQAAAIYVKLVLQPTENIVTEQ